MARAIWAVACLFSAAVLFNPASARSADGMPPEATFPAPAVTASVPAQPPAAVATSSPAPAAAAKDNAAVPARPEDSYRMGPEDILRVSVWENKELTLDVVVRPDGRISLPLIQDVQAEGLTATELSQIIHRKLEAFVKDPQVAVILLQVNAPKVYVIGSVARPGPYPLRGETSVLQALSQAGGFTQFASPRSIKLVRGSGLKQVVRKLNYYNIIDEGGEGNYLLAPGDTIVVP